MYSNLFIDVHSADDRMIIREVGSNPSFQKPIANAHLGKTGKQRQRWETHIKT